ncbi:MAG: EF-hand domain-containing protein [Hyphomicrobiaceae bacterium]
MAISKLAIATLAVFAVFSVNTEASAGHHKAKAKPVSCPELNAIDPDNDGKMSLGEALRAAKKKFRRINRDGDRTLEGAELKGVMPTKAIAAADSIIKDGKIGLIEYLLFVKRAFKYANPDKDRTIDCNELLSKQGRPLLHLLK